jgi:hypothetical protein
MAVIDLCNYCNLLESDFGLDLILEFSYHNSLQDYVGEPKQILVRGDGPFLPLDQRCKTESCLHQITKSSPGPDLHIKGAARPNSEVPAR